MNSEAKFYIPLIGFGAGILFRSFFVWGITSVGFVLLIGGVLIVVYRITRNRPAFLVGLLLVATAVGAGVFALHDTTGNTELNNLVGGEVAIEGVVSDEVVVTDASQRIVVNIERVNKKEVSGKTLIIMDRFPQFSYGDRVHATAELQKPESFVTDTGREFNYPAYLAKDGIHYQMFFPEIEQIAEGQGNFIQAILFDFKHAFLRSVERVIPQPHAGLLGGLVVGSRDSLGEKLERDFRKTGIIHIVVLSGYNVTIVAEALIRFLSFLPYIASLSIGGVGIVLFAIMTGASATIVRASIMAILVLLARATGRTYDITRALVIAGVLMLVHNPMILAFDPSFQLSFLATFGLIWVAPLIEERLSFVTTRWQLREVIVATIATQLFVLPLLLYQVGELSLVAIPVNVLILGAVPLTMFAGFITGLLGMVSTMLSLPVGYLTFGLLAYELGVVDLFASLPFASVAVPPIALWVVGLWYGVYGYVLYRLHTKAPARSGSE